MMCWKLSNFGRQWMRISNPGISAFSRLKLNGVHMSYVSSFPPLHRTSILATWDERCSVSQWELFCPVSSLPSLWVLLMVSWFESNSRHLMAVRNYQHLYQSQWAQDFIWAILVWMPTSCVLPRDRMDCIMGYPSCHDHGSGNKLLVKETNFCKKTPCSIFHDGSKSWSQIVKMFNDEHVGDEAPIWPLAACRAAIGSISRRPDAWMKLTLTAKRTWTKGSNFETVEMITSYGQRQTSRLLWLAFDRFWPSSGDFPSSLRMHKWCCAYLRLT